MNAKRQAQLRSASKDCFHTHPGYRTDSPLGNHDGKKPCYEHVCDQLQNCSAAAEASPSKEDCHQEVYDEGRNAHCFP